MDNSFNKGSVKSYRPPIRTPTESVMNYKNDILTSGWSEEATGDEGEGEAGEV